MFWCVDRCSATEEEVTDQVERRTKLIIEEEERMTDFRKEKYVCIHFRVIEIINLNGCLNIFIFGETLSWKIHQSKLK